MRKMEGRVHQIFPQVYTTLDIELTEEDERLFAKWCSIEHMQAHSYEVGSTYTDENGNQRQCSYRREPYHTLDHVKQSPVWDGDFITAYVYNDPLLSDELREFYEIIIQNANHYLRDIMQLDVPDDCVLDIVDSWFVKLRGNKQLPHHFRPHNHAFSLLSGVLYLTDGDGGLAFYDGSDGVKKQSINMHPFAWSIKSENELNSGQHRVQMKKGRLVLFPSYMYHVIVNTGDENLTRDAIAFNIWPKGLVSIGTSRKLVTRP